MGLAEQFTNLGEDFLASFDARVDFLGKNIVGTHRLLTGFQKENKARAREIGADLGAFVTDLRETVDNLRRENRKECKGAAQAWQRVAKAMASRRHNFKGVVAAAKQKAARAH